MQKSEANKIVSTSAGFHWKGLTIRLSLILLILAASASLSVYWLMNQPKARRRRPDAKATLVQVTKVAPQTHTVVVRAMGTVIPAKEIQLASQVSGRVDAVSSKFIPGGQFSVGQQMVQIERKDYELAVAQRTSDLAKAQCDLQLEMGQQSVSQQEYELLGQEVREEDKELLLRGPQLAIAKASVAAAKAAMQEAELDLRRTSITAPFNAMVRSRNVDIGSQVNVGGEMASLVGTDKYWVQVSLPVGELRWILVPSRDGLDGSPARIRCESAWGPDAFRIGTVEQLMTELETEGRMAQLLIAVEHPLDPNPKSPVPTPLILGSYVRVEIIGKDLRNVVRVPRTELRDGNKVWVMNADSTLGIRLVNIVHNDADNVYVDRGLAVGDLLITSDLASAVQGMVLRTADSSAHATTYEPATRPAQHVSAKKGARLR